MEENKEMNKPLVNKAEGKMGRVKRNPLTQTEQNKTEWAN